MLSVSNSTLHWPSVLTPNPSFSIPLPCLKPLPFSHTPHYLYLFLLLLCALVLFYLLSVRQHELASTTSKLWLQTKALERSGLYTCGCVLTQMVEGSVLTQKPSTAKSIFHRMVAQELLREKEQPELADISKTIYPALEELFRDHENDLAKIFQINSTDDWRLRQLTFLFF